MQQDTSKRLFQYWDMVRGMRRAPRRFEIEPSQIADLLPETFILECLQSDKYCFRLAGTRICQNFGRELRSINFVSFWDGHDLEAVENLLHSVVKDAAVAVLRFNATDDVQVGCDFEMVLLPLFHSGPQVNRLLGNVSPISGDHRQGGSTLTNFSLQNVELLWPSKDQELEWGGVAAREEPAALSQGFSRVVRADRRCFRVYDGGRSDK